VGVDVAAEVIVEVVVDYIMVEVIRIEANEISLPLMRFLPEHMSTRHSQVKDRTQQARMAEMLLRQSLFKRHTMPARSENGINMRRTTCPLDPGSSPKDNDRI